MEAAPSTTTPVGCGSATPPEEPATTGAVRLVAAVQTSNDVDTVPAPPSPAVKPASSGEATSKPASPAVPTPPPARPADSTPTDPVSHASAPSAVSETLAKDPSSLADSKPVASPTRSAVGSTDQPPQNGIAASLPALGCSAAPPPAAASKIIVKLPPNRRKMIAKGWGEDDDDGDELPPLEGISPARDAAAAPEIRASRGGCAASSIANGGGGGSMPLAAHLAAPSLGVRPGSLPCAGRAGGAPHSTATRTSSSRDDVELEDFGERHGGRGASAAGRGASSQEHEDWAEWGSLPDPLQQADALQAYAAAPAPLVAQRIMSPEVYMRSREAVRASTYDSWENWDEFDPRASEKRDTPGTASKGTEKKPKKGKGAGARCVPRCGLGCCRRCAPPTCVFPLCRRENAPHDPNPLPRTPTPHTWPPLPHHHTTRRHHSRPAHAASSHPHHRTRSLLSSPPSHTQPPLIPTIARVRPYLSRHAGGRIPRPQAKPRAPFRIPPHPSHTVW